MATALSDDDGSFSPELRESMRMHAEYALTLPVSELCNPDRMFECFQEVEESGLGVPVDTTFLPLSESLRDLLDIGIRCEGINIPVGPDGLERLREATTRVLRKAFIAVLFSTEINLRRLAKDPTEIGLTGANAEMFKNLFPTFQGTIEELVETVTSA